MKYLLPLSFTAILLSLSIPASFAVDWDAINRLSTPAASVSAQSAFKQKTTTGNTLTWQPVVVKQASYTPPVAKQSAVKLPVAKRPVMVKQASYRPKRPAAKRPVMVRQAAYTPSVAEPSIAEQRPRVEENIRVVRRTQAAPVAYQQAGTITLPRSPSAARYGEPLKRSTFNPQGALSHSNEGGDVTPGSVLTSLPKKRDEGACTFKITPIAEIDLDISPENIAKELKVSGPFPPECNALTGKNEPRNWGQIAYHWKASNYGHLPLYYEDRHLETYGHSWGPVMQPVVSGANFVLQTVLLPYQMGMYPPRECQYELGDERPGNCVPYYVEPLPLSLRGAAAQTGAVLGIHYGLFQ